MPMRASDAAWRAPADRQTVRAPGSTARAPSGGVAAALPCRPRPPAAASFGAGAPARWRRIVTLVALVRLDDARHQRVAHDIGGGEINKADAAHVAPDVLGFDQARRGTARQ